MQIFISPITYSTGIKTKILEAMSYKIPVISIYKVGEGLNVKDEKEFLLVKDNHGFVKKVILLLKHTKLQKKLMKNLKNILKTIIQKKRFIMS